VENLREPLDRAGSREKDGRLFLYAAPDLWSVDVSVAGLTASVGWCDIQQRRREPLLRFYADSKDHFSLSFLKHTHTHVEINASFLFSDMCQCRYV
jgi:hypothetical protein